jgi:hypothetical protein
MTELVVHLVVIQRVMDCVPGPEQERGSYRATPSYPWADMVHRTNGLTRSRVVPVVSLNRNESATTGCTEGSDALADEDTHHHPWAVYAPVQV